MPSLFEHESPTSVRFFIEGPPIALPRHRDSIVFTNKTDAATNECPRCKKGCFVHKYIPKEHPVHAFKDHCKLMAKAAFRGEPWKGPLRVTMLILMKRPDNLPKSTPGRIWMPKKPDRDNIEKAVFDALTGIVWVDDSQVCDGPIRKMYAAVDEPCGVDIMIEVIE